MKSITKFLGRNTELFFGSAMYFYGGWIFRKDPDYILLCIAIMFGIIWVISVFCKETPKEPILIKINGKTLNTSKVGFIDITGKNLNIEGATFDDRLD